MGKTNDRLIPGVVLRSIAGGMLFMAVFTYGWIRIAVSGLEASSTLWLWLAVVFGVLLIVNAFYFLIVSKHFPGIDSEADRAEGKRMGMWYGILLGGEGVIIGGTCGVLLSTGHAEFMIPSIALIIGLHFFPMAKLFKRTIDYYIAAWTCIIGITAIFMIRNGIDLNMISVFTGFGVAAATATYGVYMVFAGFKIVRTRNVGR